DHDVIAVAHGDDADDRAVALAGADVAQTLAAAALPAIPHRRAIDRFALFALLRRRLFGGLLLDLRFLSGGIRAERRPFPVAVFANGEQVSFRIGDNQPDDCVARLQVDAFDAASVSAHRAGIAFGEANRHAHARAEDHL